MYDVVVIGAGHNGLAAALYLAKRGYKVIVFEKRDKPGGMAVSEELWPGHKVSIAAYVVSLLDRRLIKEGRLEERGFKIIPKDPTITVLPEGKPLKFYRDIKRTLREIEKVSKKDAQSYIKYQMSMEKAAEIVWRIANMPLPFIKSFSPKILIDLLFDGELRYFMRNIEGLSPDFIQMLLTSSALKFVNEWFESEEVKAALVPDGIIGLDSSPATSGTAYLLLHHLMGEVEGVRGAWGYVAGGIGRFCELLADAVKEAGAEIYYNMGVSKVIVDNGVAKGVLLENGKEVRAKAIVSTANYALTMLEMVGEEHLEEEFVRRVRSLNMRGVSAKLLFLLKSLPECPVGKDAYASSIYILDNIRELERGWLSSRQGTPSQRPFLSLNVQGFLDQSVIGDKGVWMSIFAQYYPREAESLDLKDKFLTDVIEMIEERLPNFKRNIIEYKVLTPADFEVMFSNPGGNIFQLDMQPDQVLFARPVPGYYRYTTPIKGLFIAGSSSHPGGGITGLPGRHGANAVMKFLKGGR